MRFGFSFILGACLVITGCGPRIAYFSGEETSGGESTTGGPLTTTTSTSTTTSTTSSTSGSAETSSGEFIMAPDCGERCPVQCDHWEQDCPRGEKCMPWANDGGSSWNALKCTPLDPNPKGLYEPCMVERNAVSGIDNCDIRMMCWNVDPETNEGVCYGMCLGSESDPSCADPEAACRIYGDGVITLCYPGCHPLLQDCAQGLTCIPGYDNEFTCVLDASGRDGQYGDPCEYANVCDPGLFCADPAAVPNCEGSSGCCTEFCDLKHPDGDAQCAGFADGQVCVPWFEEGQAPEKYQDVGACVLP